MKLVCVFNKRHYLWYITMCHLRGSQQVQHNPDKKIFNNSLIRSLLLYNNYLHLEITIYRADGGVKIHTIYMVDQIADHADLHYRQWGLL